MGLRFIEEPVRSRVMRNLDIMRRLSNEQIRIINLGTSGEYVEDRVAVAGTGKYPPEDYVITHELPKQDKWIWHLKHDKDTNIKPSSVYDKAYHIITTALELNNSLPIRTEQEESELREALDSCPDFLSKATLVGLSSLMRPKDDAVAKARHTAWSMWTAVRERALDFVRRYEDRTIKEEDYSYFTTCKIEEFIDDTLVV
ncbi:hypothetical protein HY450_00640 [Candidatus Pacearchaeota archaeon]|nr:hypothetical protein [Candidatus Pacearchaeota archaeon]